MTGAPCSGVKSPKNTARKRPVGARSPDAGDPAYHDVGAPTGTTSARPRCRLGQRGAVLLGVDDHDVGTAQRSLVQPAQQPLPEPVPTPRSAAVSLAPIRWSSTTGTCGNSRRASSTSKCPR